MHLRSLCVRVPRPSRGKILRRQTAAAVGRWLHPAGSTWCEQDSPRLGRPRRPDRAHGARLRPCRGPPCSTPSAPRPARWRPHESDGSTNELGRLASTTSLCPAFAHGLSVGTRRPVHSRPCREPGQVKSAGRQRSAALPGSWAAGGGCRPWKPSQEERDSGAVEDMGDQAEGGGLGAVVAGQESWGFQ